MTLFKLRVALLVFGCLYHSRRYSSRLHQVHNILCSAVCRPLIYQNVQFRLMLLATDESAESGGIRQRRPADYFAKALPFLVSEHSNGAPPILAPTPIGIVRSSRRVLVTVSASHAT